MQELNGMDLLGWLEYIFVTLTPNYGSVSLNHFS